MDKETQDTILYHQYHVLSQIDLIARVTGKNHALRELEKSFNVLIQVYHSLIDHEIDGVPFE